MTSAAKLLSSGSAPTQADVVRAEVGLRKELVKALNVYLGGAHDAPALKAFCVSITKAGKRNVPVGEPFGGHRQKLIGAVLEAAMTKSRGAGKPQRLATDVVKMFGIWSNLVLLGNATFKEVPATRIADLMMIEHSVCLGKEAVRKALTPYRWQ